ncbi:hypothetical protein [Candidatus Midichloria mitochondrii]|uniref:hypothetical protein n=1 Tax=Candidatus Midichloria mitochondrii TaxID=234827 RepID=UPI0002E143D5|nr:hypothetical protein [Candidatus Midichloria mitochondrii]
MIELKGIFLGSNEQLLIQDLAFNKRNFSGTIKHTNFEIEAIFDIQKYEISNDIGELDHFKLKLECKKSLKHTILSVEV